MCCAWARVTNRQTDRAGEKPEQHMLFITPIIITSHSLLMDQSDTRTQTFTNTLTENLFRTRQFSITADNYAEDVTTGGDSELRHTLKHRQQRAGDKKDRRRKYRNAHTHRHTHWSEDRHVYMSGALNVISVSDLNLLWFKKVNKWDHRIKTLVFIEFQIEMNGKYIFIFKMYFTEQRLYCWIWQQKKV